MSSDAINSFSPFSCNSQNSTSHHPLKKYHSQIYQPPSEKSPSLNTRSITLDNIQHANKKMRLTSHEVQMVKIQKESAESHDLDTSKLPIETPKRGGIPLTLTATAHTLKGKRVVNEDQHVIVHKDIGDFFAICDGHGIIDKKKLEENKSQIGQDISKMVADSIENELPHYISENHFNTKIAFEKWCKHIHSQIPWVVGGTTVVIGFYERITQLLHVATVGDSEVVVFRKKKDLIYPIPMSPEMSWNHPEAINRVKQILSPEEFEKWNQVPLIKQKRFPPEKGVNLGWSLGDKLMTVNYQTAVSHIPKCSLLQLQPGDIILFGCDGIFDVTNVDELIDKILEPHWDKPNANLSELIANFSLHTKNSTDNVTALVVRAGPRIQGSLQVESPSTQPTEDNDF